MKIRNPRSFATAIYKIVQQVGVKACAMAVHRSPALIYKWSDPEATAAPTLGQALTLDREYMRRGFGPPPVLMAYTAMLKDELRNTGTTPSQSTADAVNDIAQLMIVATQIMKDFGQAHLAARDAAAPKHAVSCNVCNNLRQIGMIGASLEWQIAQDKEGVICPISGEPKDALVCLKQDD